MPHTFGRSHFRTQEDLYQKAAAKRTWKLARVSDFLKTKGLAWAWHYIRSRFGRKHPFQDYRSSSDDTGIYALAASASAEDSEGSVTLALAGDWASGTRDAEKIGTLIENARPHFTVHLGDIYYVGTKKEVKENMLGEQVRWPAGSRGSFSLNSNHEMYAKGKGYFKHLLPELGMRAPSGAPLGQRASFFCLRNEHWLVIGIDTGYYSVGLPVLEKVFKPNCRLHGELIRWLRDDVEIQADRTRGIILLSHHQYYSQFEGLHDKAAEQLSGLVDRPVLWFWGHEHRLALYGRRATAKGKLEAYGRCIGHGGLPIEDIGKDPKTDSKHQMGLVVYDRRSNKKVGHSQTPVGFNGFAILEFDGRALTIIYRDIEDRPLLREKWSVEQDGRLKGKTIEQLSSHEDIRLHSSHLKNAIK